LRRESRVGGEGEAGEDTAIAIAIAIADISSFSSFFLCSVQNLDRFGSPTSSSKRWTGVKLTLLIFLLINNNYNLFIFLMVDSN